MGTWGWNVRTKTLAEGTFFSPAAGEDAPYRLVEVRRWFVLFSIPIAPANVLGTFVECQATKTTYDPAVLDNPADTEFTDQLSGALREVIAAVMVADEEVVAAERETALTILRDHVGEHYDDDALTLDLRRAEAGPLDDRLIHLAGALNEHGKEELLTSAVDVMVADGTVDDREIDLIRLMGEHLSLPASHVRDVIDQVADRIRPD